MAGCSAALARVLPRPGAPVAAMPLPLPPAAPDAVRQRCDAPRHSPSPRGRAQKAFAVTPGSLCPPCVAKGRSPCNETSPVQSRVASPFTLLPGSSRTFQTGPQICCSPCLPRRDTQVPLQPSKPTLPCPPPQLRDTTLILTEKADDSLKNEGK